MKCEESISNAAIVNVITMPLNIINLMSPLKSLPADKVMGLGD